MIKILHFPLDSFLFYHKDYWELYQIFGVENGIKFLTRYQIEPISESC